MSGVSSICRKCKNLSPVSISTISPDTLGCRAGLYDFGRKIRVWKGIKLPRDCPLKGFKRISKLEWEQQYVIAQKYWFGEER